ncbi:polyketide synthase A [Aspergillus steynii IBT 23096]|uniref:Polyketide synthase A n=1 Tax=Aspergillus steynii IBT 23096 TaxID=1392250 RepID=A0A2I2FW25_9EURO|nr:polyketide synthase A [Aspergillus steynii IBT 23096]PLB44840.1 polyketide synthase A [Aspergillus steynii IBT 23096]
MMNLPIAVVGTACRFPGSVTSPSQLFELLSNPEDVLSDLDPERFNLSSFHDRNLENNGPTNVPRKSYMLDDSGLHFDASFFKVSAAEAEAMDPQQRLLLETTYEALEAAGYTLKQIRGSSTSVFAGAMTSDYHDIQTRDLDTISRWHATGTSPSILSNRLSYFFDLKGPSMTINTACSSSLVALHQAVQSLRNGECTTAIVAGVNLLLDPDTYLSHSNLHMLSPTSRCRMWDRDADGYARGEGCAAVVIKTLDQALEDGDDVGCIIRGTAVNSDGRSAGITMPNLEAQTMLIRQAYERSGLDPVRDRCQYFECHGTGTQAGDPVEAQAIQQAFYPKDATFDPNDKLHVGSIKTLIGHLEGCAGLAGLLKAILCVKNRTITPNLLFNNLNPSIAPFYEHLSVPTRTVPWPFVAPGHPPRASVNSFGFGGTNAHAIIESYIPRQSPSDTGGSQELNSDTNAIPTPFLFSAHTQHSLCSTIERFTEYVKENEGMKLDDVAWTLAKRSILPFRVSITASGREELLQCLEQAIEEYKGSKGSEPKTVARKHSSEPKEIMGVFTGQGAQWPQMGQELLPSLCDGPSWSLQEELRAEKQSSRLSNPEISQPVTTAIEIAVYDLMCACGISLDAVVGHSSGEIVAAYALDIISAEDAMKIAYYRGLNTKPAQSGGMLAVGLSFRDAIQLCFQASLSGRIVAAASNGPASTTLSGDYDAILEAKALLDQKKTFARMLQVDAAYHSHHMVACAAAYRKSLKACDIHVRTPRSDCTWVSSVTGNSATLDIQQFSCDYWVDNMVNPVLFSQAVEKTIGQARSLGVCVEIGPHPALRGPVLDTLLSKSISNIPYTSFLHRGHNDLKAAARAAGCLWEGVPERLDIGKVLQAFGKQSPKLIKGLPTYSWDHRNKYWRESRVARNYRVGSPELHPLLGRRCINDIGNEMSRRNIIHPEQLPWVQGHKYNSECIISAAFYFSSLVAAACSAAETQCLPLLQVNDFVALNPLIIDSDCQGIEYVTTIHFQDQMSDSKLDAEAACYACNIDGSMMRKLCTARLTLRLDDSLPDSDRLPPREKRYHTLTPVDVAAMYESFEKAGTGYSGPFRNITSIQRGLGHATASASWGPETGISGCSFHPAMLESSFQTMLCAFASPLSKRMWTSFNPMEIRQALVTPGLVSTSSSCEIDAFVTASGDSEVVGDVSFHSESGSTMVQIEGLVMKSDRDPDKSTDRNIFSHLVWEIDPFGYPVIPSNRGSENKSAGLDEANMVALYYFQKALYEIDPFEVPGFMPHHQHLYREIRRIVTTEDSGSPSTIYQSGGSEDSIQEKVTGSGNRIHLESIHSLGKALPAILRGEVNPFDLQNGVGSLGHLYQSWGILSEMKVNICNTLKRIVHKHPHMEILELGSDPGIATQQILEELNGNYASYCLSGSDPTLLGEQMKLLSIQHQNLKARLIDLTTASIPEPGSDMYDMVLAANPLQATGNPTSLFERCRKMLKPGGYLIFARVTGRIPSSLLCTFGLFPEWWQGYDQSMQAWPEMASVQCDRQLRSAGFAGIDHIFPSSPLPDEGDLSVIVTQAVDDTVAMLREPMSSIGLAPPTDIIVLIGGKTLPVSRLLHSIRRVLAASGATTEIVEDLDELELKSLPGEYSIISLTELDQPFFSNSMFHEKVIAFKELVQKSKHVLWLTAGDMAVSLAVGRAMRSKASDNAHLQLLELSTVTKVPPAFIVEVFLRLTWSSLPTLMDGKTLWTNEPELYWDGSTLRIPRVVQDHERNKRYSSECRKISPVASSSHVPVTTLAMNDVPVSIDVQVMYSILLSEDVYLWLGTATTGSENMIGFSENISSVIQVNPDSVHTISLDGDDLSPENLRAIASFSLALLLVKSSSGPMIIYQPDELLATAIHQVRQTDRKVYFVTSNRTYPPKGWIAIHPHASQRMIQRVLPRKLSNFVDLSCCDDNVGTRLRTLYHKILVHPESLYRLALLTTPKELIAEAYTQTCISLSTLPRVDLELVPSAETSSSNRSLNHSRVVDWTSLAPVMRQSECQDPFPMFSSTGTYWMIDMVSPLGLSVVTWMARNGARTFVLADRRPRVNKAWLEEMNRLGATVKVMKMDASNKESVLSAFGQIKEASPPIVGVCYAPLALSHEGCEYTLEDERVVVPNAKIDAAMYLDGLFSNPTLDLFVLFTSLVSVIGTPKQVSHHASAPFMSGVIQRRRKRGLVGSMLSLGIVVDAGYFARQDKEAIQHMVHQGYSPLSETDLHHGFREAIAAGRPERQENPEVFLGLQKVDLQSDQDCQLSWSSSPLLSHFTTKVDQVRPEQSAEEHSSSVLHPEKQSQESEPEQNTSDVLLERLADKIASMLRLPAGTLDIHTPLLDLGCDSLFAVDIQTWFAKELDIHISAMDALLATVAGLCQKAIPQPDTHASVPQKEDQYVEESDSTDVTTLTSNSQQDNSSKDLLDKSSSSQSSCDSPSSESWCELQPSITETRFTRVEKMSPDQSQIWFAGHWMADPNQYNVVISYNVHGNFQFEKFQRVLEQAVFRHESLRTAFFTDPNTGDLLQGVLTTQPPFFNHVTSSEQGSVSEEFDKLASYQWRLEQGEVIRVTVVSVGQDQHTVIFGYHHIVMDGASWSAFLNDVKCFYKGSPLCEVGQYVDYSLQLNCAIDDGAFAKELEYWKHELSPPPEAMPVLPFAKSNTREATDNFKMHTASRHINIAVADMIKHTSRSLRGTPFHFHLATLQVLLVRLLKIENLCIGMSDANRKDQQFVNTVGYFLNMLPLRFHVKQTDSFTNVFQNTSSKVLTAISNSSIPSNLVIDELKIPRASNVTPLFQVALNYRVGEITRMSVEDFELNYDRSVMGNAPYDMSFHVTPCADGTCIVELNCRDYLYSPQATELTMDTYVRLLETLSSDPSHSVQSSLPSVKPVNEDGLSVHRGPRQCHDWPSTLSERFQNMADQYGDRVAVTDDTGEFTYSQLHAQSTHIAKALLQRGVASGDKVAVLCHPSVSSVASMLAILRIGAVYVPLDLSLPPARHKAMMEAAAVTAIICMSSRAEIASELKTSVVINVSEVLFTEASPMESISDDINGNSLSILLYTSGSTGQPKGVCLPQVGFINYLAAKQKELGLDSSTVVLQQSSLGFDMGLAQTFNAIMNGGKLVIVPQEVRGDSVEIAKIMRDHGVSFTLATPSEYLVMIQHGREYLSQYTGWKQACLGGEPFTDQLKREFARLGKNCPIVQDSYGVTEISACTTFQTMSASELEETRSVGRTISNTSLYIVGPDFNLVPTGETGEICVGGAGIALGYIDEKQTKLKFVEDPFALPEDIARGWTRMYHTGDKGQLHKDGSLILLGRMNGNTEIKLRGLRIDLEDVASTMLNCHPDLLSSAIVCVKDQGDSETLVAFVALNPGQMASHAELQHLASSLPLPQYMHPAAVICLEELPRNPNGKVDRKRIEAMPWTAPTATTQPSKRLTLGEGELKLLWQNLLSGQQIQPESDFFLLGGNSLLLVKLQGAIRNSVGVSLTLRELYSASTLALMAVKVQARKAEVPSTSVNWLAETAIPPNVLNYVSSIPRREMTRRSQGSGCEILLAGSTSFLGRVLAQTLLQVPEVQRLHCIAVDKEQGHVLPTSDKISVYHGTLLDPMLGLSSTKWASLQRCIDVVIHGGSNGHCLNTYNSLKGPNLGSTHRLAEFALQAQIPLHYISSGRVILQSGQTSLGPVSLSLHPPPLDGSDGLTATKWVSEVFLERLAEESGASISIHRPCTPIGDQAPAQDALNSLLRYSATLGATPRLTRMEGYLDFQKVETLAKDIATLVISRFTEASPRPSLTPSGVSFFHHSSNVRVPVKSFKEYMEKVHNRPFQELSLRDWSSLALEGGIEPLIPSFLEAVDDNQDTLRYPYLGR